MTHRLSALSLQDNEAIRTREAVRLTSRAWQEINFMRGFHEGGLKFIIENTVLIINAMALVIIVIGTIEAFFVGLWATLSGSATKRRKREVWLRYSRWLVAGLTFLVEMEQREGPAMRAADSVAKSLASDW